MGSKLESQWWYGGLVTALSMLSTRLVFESAGLPLPDNLAQWILCAFCFVCTWRCFSFLGWLGVLLIAPASRLLEPTLPR